MLALILRRSAKVLGALIMILLILAGIAVARLAYGPVSLTAYASDIESRVNEGLAGWRVDIGDVSLGWSAGEHRLRVRLERVTLRAPDGRLMAGAPRVGLRLHPLAAVQGRLSVAEVDVVGLRALLARTAEGRFRLAVLDTKDEAAPAEDAASPENAENLRVAPAGEVPAVEDASPEAFDAVAAAIEAASSAAASDSEPGPFARFERLRLVELDLSYDDRMSDQRWTFPGSALEIRRGEDGLQARLQGHLLTSPGAEPVALTLIGERSGDGAEAVLSAQFRDAPTSALASQVPALDVIEKVEGRLSGVLGGRLDLATGDLKSLSGDLSAEGAIIELTETRSLVFKKLAASLAYDPASDRVTLRGLQMRNLRDDTLRASGEAWLLRNADGSFKGVDGALTIDGAQIVDPLMFSEPFNITGGGLQFSLDVDPWRLDVSAAKLETPDVSFTGRASAQLTPALAVEAEASVGAFPVRRLAAIWPLQAAPGGRRWVAENIREGDINGGTLKVSSLEGEAPLVDFSFTFSDLATTYVGEMTPITKGAGSARLGADRFELNVDAGTVDLGEKGALALNGSKFVIPTFEVEPERGEIDLAVKGPVKALLDLLDQEPLTLISKLGQDLGEVEGSVEAQARLELPLIADLPLEDVSASVEAKLAGLELTAPGLGERVRASEATLNADTSELRLTGDMRSMGETFAVDWREVFAPEEGEARTSLDVAVGVTAKQLVGWGAPSQFFTGGSVWGRAELNLVDGAAPSVTGSVDLKRLQAAAPTLGWSKEAGAAGSARFAGVLVDGGARFSSLRITSGGLRVEGSGSIDWSTGLRSFTLDHLVVDDETDLALTISRIADGELRVTGGGPRLKLVAGSVGAGEGGRVSGAPVSFDVNIDSLRVGEKTRIEGLSAQGRRDADGVVTGEATGRTAAGAALALQASREGDRQKLLLSSEKAGEALVGLGVFEDAAGGRMRLIADVTPAGEIFGDLEIDDVVIKNTPPAAKALQVGSLVGVFEQIQSGGLAMSRVRATFHATPSVIEIREAWARGPSIGLVIDGDISRPAGALDLRGTVSPAFIINGLLSEVPVLGDLLTGGKGEGIVGVDFTVRGDLDDPKVSVNPLTALTPGVFRRIFSGEGGGARTNNDDSGHRVLDR